MRYLPMLSTSPELTQVVVPSETRAEWTKISPSSIAMDHFGEAPANGGSQVTVMVSCVAVAIRFCGPRGKGCQPGGADSVRKL